MRVWPVITKLTEQWKTDQQVFADRDLSEVDCVYRWVDSVDVDIRVGENKLYLTAPHRRRMKR